MKKRNVLNSPRLLELKKGRRRVLLGKILLFILAFLVVFFLLAYISRLPSLNISAIEINGNKAVETDTIKASVQKEIEGKYLWLFPRTNIFLYPKKDIEKNLSNQFTRLNDVNLSIKNSKILEVKLTERVALYTWCGIVLPETAPNQKCYFMDEDGFIFDEAPYFSGGVYFKFYGTTNLEGNVPSSGYFSEQNFKKLISFKKALENIKLKPVALYIQDDGDVTILLSGGIKSSEPEIILKVDSDIQKVAENLEAALTTEPLQSNFKNKYSSLLYIDLRLNNKVYYKFK